MTTASVDHGPRAGCEPAGWSRLRVALVMPYSWSFRGGVRSHVIGLAGALRERAVEVDVIAPAEEADTFPGLFSIGRSIPIPDNGSIVRVALSPGAILRTAWAVRTGGYDLLHLQEPLVPAVCLTALYAARAPVVGTFHMYAPGPRWYRTFAPICRHAAARLDARIAVSGAARRHVAQVCHGHYRIIPNGIEVSDFAAPHTGGGGSRLLFIGRPERRKGLPVLLRALARLPSPVTLDLVGVEPAQLTRAAAGLGPEVLLRVHAHGCVSDAERARLLARADVLCVPSLGAESFGIVIVEGMAAGVPVVASAISGYADVLPERAGRLVPPGDPAALAAAIGELLADPGLRARLGAAGRAEARRYDWSAVASSVLDVYREVLSRARPDRPAAGGPVRARPLVA